MMKAKAKQEIKDREAKERYEGVVWYKWGGKKVVKEEVKEEAKEKVKVEMHKIVIDKEKIFK